MKSEYLANTRYSARSHTWNFWDQRVAGNCNVPNYRTLYLQHIPEDRPDLLICHFICHPVSLPHFLFPYLLYFHNKAWILFKNNMTIIINGRSLRINVGCCHLTKRWNVMVSPVPDNQPLLYYFTWNEISYTEVSLKHVYEGASPLHSDAVITYHFLTHFQYRYASGKVKHTTTTLQQKLLSSPPQQ